MKISRKGDFFIVVIVYFQKMIIRTCLFSIIYTNFLQDMLRGCRLLSNDEDKNEGLVALPDFEENSSDCSSDKINSKRFRNLSVAQQLDEDYYCALKTIS